MQTILGTTITEEQLYVEVLDLCGIHKDMTDDEAAKISAANRQKYQDFFDHPWDPAQIYWTDDEVAKIRAVAKLKIDETTTKSTEPVTDATKTTKVIVKLYALMCDETEIELPADKTWDDVEGYTLEDGRTITVAFDDNTELTVARGEEFYINGYEEVCSENGTIIESQY